MAHKLQIKALAVVNRLKPKLNSQEIYSLKDRDTIMLCKDEKIIEVNIIFNGII